MSQLVSVVIGEESLLIGCVNIWLDRGHQVLAVVSKTPEIQSWAKERGLKLVEKASEVTGDFDWLLSIANLSIIPEDFLRRAGQGAVNFHDGPLPRYAGLNTPNWALINGEVQHGITWHVMEGGVDEGDVLVQRRFNISEQETGFSLNSKCYAAAIDSFGEVLEQLENGLQRRPQDLSQRIYYAKSALPTGAGRLDFSQSSEYLARLIRSLDFGGYWNPMCLPKVFVDEQFILAKSASLAKGRGIPGTVLEVSQGSVDIACGHDSAIKLSDLFFVSGVSARPENIFEIGMRLPLPLETEVDEIDAVMSRSQRGERYWRNRLHQMSSLSVPASRSTNERGWLNKALTNGVGLSEAQIATAVGAWALQGSGESAGDIALRATGMMSTFGLISDWGPLFIDGAEPISSFLNNATETLEKIGRLGGFALDIVMRAPELTAVMVPAFGLSLGIEAPIEGVAVTVSHANERLNIHFDKSKLSTAECELLTARLELILSSILTHGSQLVRDLTGVPDAERQMILKTWNQTAEDFDSEQTIHGAFEAQVEKQSDSIALVFEAREYTYAELNARANAVANKLRELGAIPGSYIGIYIKRSPEMVIAALAIMKSGAAYVPLDPAYPADRIAHYISDSGAGIIITQSALSVSLPASSAKIVEIDKLALNSSSEENIQGGAEGKDLAYLIYTSGSTGKPKGVMIRHANVSNFFIGMDKRIPYKSEATWLAVTSLSFDISVLELFWTLSRGFKVILSSDESRIQISNGAVGWSDRKMDFNLFYWGNDDGAGSKKYELLIEGAKFADKHGFNAIWTPERHFHAFGGPYPNPAVTGAAVAAVTENLGVRAGSCVAPLHHPARIAEEWAVIDNLTNGQAGIGFASGWQPDDFVLRPENTPPANKSALFSSIETVRELWRGEEVGFLRKDRSEHRVVSQPRPVSKELAVWVTTAGNPETWRQAGKIGANVLTHLLGQSIEEVGDKIRIYHQALRESGRDPKQFKVTLMLHTFLAESRDKARRIAREPMKDYLRSAAGLIKQYAWAFPAFKKPDGVKNAFEMDLGGLSEQELEAILDFAFERYFEDSGLFGTIDDALLRVEALKRIEVDEIACLIDYGIEPATVLEGLKPLAEVLKRSNAPREVPDDDFSLAAQMVRHQVSHMQCTPSLARMIAMNDEARVSLGSLEHLMLGGEALPGDLVKSLRTTTKADIHNMYGPTETTIWSTVDTLDESGIQDVASIGMPIANTEVLVLSESGRLQPVGAPGELFIGGAGVAAGYWQRKELTDERFVTTPYLDGLFYRTGDLVRWRADGKLDFLGRTDHQVKIRGQRIELGEIEAVMAAFPGVSGAIVMLRKMGEGERLVGYITGSDHISESELKKTLATKLAEVMIPAHIVQLDAFPLTPNKKIDRKALPEPKLGRSHVANKTAESVEGVSGNIAKIWRQILGVDHVLMQDNFFSLGGHSLLAVQAHREIREQLKVSQLAITDIFKYPTLGGLTRHIEERLGTTQKNEVTETAVSKESKAETMSKRRAMRANRKVRVS